MTEFHEIPENCCRKFEKKKTVMFDPREIVSGQFYTMYTLDYDERNENDSTILSLFWHLTNTKNMSVFIDLKQN